MGKKKLLDLAKESKLNNIRIKLGKETIRFNLFEELIVNENKLTDESLEQPLVYGYLGMVHQKLTRLCADAQQEVDKLKSLALVRAKGVADPLSLRAKSKELAEAEAEIDEEYQDALTTLHTLKHQKGILYTCLKSFEQRKDLIQTVSANVRKEI